MYNKRIIKEHRFLDLNNDTFTFCILIIVLNKNILFFDYQYHYLTKQSI